ncbi:GGDEF domain-containing protein [Micromonospora sp. NPDC048170]|uniref:GGDEF domain-containing protein n=1 Tax=Micromonospora sp. NPDC048170 TaxID=3154819 RepID=UPI0033D6C2FB
MLAYSLATLNLALTLAITWLAHKQRLAIIRLNTLLTVAEYDAAHDDLTGLLNRRAIITHLNKQLDAARPVSVALIDLDDFKGINDTYGHDAGDAALTEAARRLKALPVTIGRLGGDEFLMVATADEPTGFAHAAAAQAAIANARIDAAGQTIQLSATAGVAHTAVEIGAPELLRRADRAMYGAKIAGAPIRAYHEQIPDVPAHAPQRRRTYRP